MTYDHEVNQMDSPEQVPASDYLESVRAQAADSLAMMMGSAVPQPAAA